PAIAGATAPSTEPYLGQVASAWQSVEGDDGLMLYTDWASPTMYQTLASNFQKLMADKTSGQDMATAVQADWTKFDETLKQLNEAGFRHPPPQPSAGLAP